MKDYEFRDYVPTKPYRRVPEQERPLPVSMDSPRFKAKPPPVPLVELSEEVDELADLEFNIDFKKAIVLEDEPPEPPEQDDDPIVFPPIKPVPRQTVTRVKPAPVRVKKRLPGGVGTVAEILEFCHKELEINCSLQEAIAQSEMVLQKLAVAEKPISAKQLVEMTGIEMKQLIIILRRLRLWEMITMLANAKKKQGAMWTFLSWIGKYRKRKAPDVDKGDNA